MNLRPENIELQDKIMEGVKRAVQKLVISSAEKDEKLVVADKEGNVLYVPAKDLLNTLPGNKKS